MELLSTKWREQLRLYCQDDLPIDISDWPKDWQEEFEERVAIMECDGELVQQEAERQAEDIVRDAYQAYLTQKEED